MELDEEEAIYQVSAKRPQNHLDIILYKFSFER